MRRVRNIAGLSEATIRSLESHLDAEPATAWVTNLRKGQYVNLLEADGREWVVKTYFHKTWQHRLVSMLGMANADRYVKTCHALAAAGVTVPTPALVMKRGDGPLPGATLMVMERLPGDMLVNHLSAIEADPARMQDIARKIAAVISALRRSRIAHRDLNAKNFLVTKDNRVSLIDFDFASRHAYASPVFRRRHRRDVRTFLNHCGPHSSLAMEVARLLEHP
jgi:tRNA A-37 threonylcarbamoyl transferase component Bud32